MSHTLLLADDSVTIQRVIELTFADEDVEVFAVGDGQQAIDRIRTDPPDIILADVDMPERDGFEVAGFVKGNRQFEHIPVLLLTGAFEPIDESRVAAAGCDGVLAKPFEPQLLIARVKELLGAARKSTPAEAPLPAALAQAPAGAVRPPAGAAAVWSPAPPAAPPVAAVPLSAERPSPLSLDDYFDRLDEAFSTLGAGRGGTANAGAPVPSGQWPPQSPSLDDLSDTVPAPPGAGVRPPGLVTTFSALLSAEQREATPAVSLPATTQPLAPIDALVEEVTRRVIESATGQAIRDQVATVVSEIAERLIREEIERLKALHREDA